MLAKIKINDKLQDGTNTATFLRRIICEVKKNEKITVMLESEVEEVNGHAGNFKAKIRTKDGCVELDFGAAIIAIGAKPLEPYEYYHFGENERIITQKDLERLLEKGLDAKRVVMVQCVGAREERRPYCSRVCCTEAIKNAIRIKEINPETEVYILYRDVRTYGIWESLYNIARSLGVMFIRYTEENKPIVDPESLTVTFPELLMNKRMVIHPDLIVLSNTIIPNEDNEKISRLFKVPLGQNGFFLEAHVKLRPVDFATDGVFVCGTAHYPKMVNEAIAQASAAASRACTILSKDYIESEGAISVVNEEKCKGCGMCVEVCPFKAIELRPEEIVLGKVRFQTRSAYINPIICKGCGSCAVACPVDAITPQHFTKQQIVASVEAALVKA